MSALAGRLVGWREWHVDGDGDLLPMGVTARSWLPGVNHAECVRATHPAPDHDCECGLYARYDETGVGNLSSGTTVIVGVVAAWGEVELHADGFRAEYAEVVCLVCSHDTGVLNRMVCEHIAERYGVPVLPRDKAAEVAASVGCPVPHDLIPERPTYGEGSAPTGVGLMIGGTARNVSVSGNWVAKTARGLAPRPVTMSGFSLTHSNVYLTSGMTLSNGNMSHCVLHGADFHPGPIAWSLVALGLLVGALVGVCCGLLF